MMKNHVVLAATVAVCISLVSAHSPQEHGHGRVTFQEFPRSAGLFREDIRPFVSRIIEAHGEEEWEIVVLTNEFHTHLGIYSIIGAKMGLKAREYFGVGLDELSVTSFAGSTPPISCLSDGLQVSTGATLGHGTIAVAKTPSPKPRAAFTHNDTTVLLQLKQQYCDMVKQDIKRGVEQHGLESEEYWLFVRRLGIQYWLNWSRNDIFDLEVAGQKK
jgi:pyrimidine-specific ribonucleoside hydrolase